MFLQSSKFSRLRLTSFNQFHWIRIESRVQLLKGEEPALEKMDKILKQSVDSIQSDRQKPLNKSAEDTKIETLHNKRKDLPQKANKTQLISEKRTYKCK